MEELYTYRYPLPHLCGSLQSGHSSYFDAPPFTRIHTPVLKRESSLLTTYSPESTIIEMIWWTGLAPWESRTERGTNTAAIHTADFEGYLE